MKNSQYEIAQVPVASTTNTATDNSSVTTTTTDSTANNTATTNPTPSTDPSVGNPEKPNTDKGENKPIVLLMNKPDGSKGVVTPSDVVYFGVMGAIIVALLAVAYNAVRTAKVPS